MTDLEFFGKYCKDIETKFRVDEEKRTVTCIITTKNDFISKIIKYGFAEIFNQLPLELRDIREEDEDIRKYVGIAKCNPDDKWDEEFGKHLAEQRAMTARRADINNEIAIFINRMNRCIDNLYLYGRLYPSKKSLKR